jgi:hypothetical protein
MKFKSAVDWWYHLVIITAAIVVVLVVIPPMISGHLSIPLGGATLLLSLALPVWILFSTAYHVDAKCLKIRSGPFSWKILLADVQSIEPSRSWLSSPALSLDRLEIRYGNGRRILVSPRDRAGFLDAVNRKKAAG